MTAHIDFVSGISELIDDTRIAPKSSLVSASDKLVTPSVLKTYPFFSSALYSLKTFKISLLYINRYYQIPDGANATNPKSSQAIGAFDDYFSAGALQAFDKNFGITGVNIQSNGPNCLNGSSPCDQFESDLDVQVT